MPIDLLNLEPTKISRDLKGKYILIYAQPKAGKTSLAVQFPKNLLLAFEKGYNGLAGIKAIDIPKWAILKEVLKELRKPAVQESFDSIIFDTATIAWERCEEYVCAQNGVSDLGEMAYGKGYKACKKEFNKVLREISMLGYGIVFLAHSEEKMPLGGEEGDQYICPMLEKRAYAIINGMVDIIAYIDVDHETGKRYLQTRATQHIVAGSRFHYLPERFELSYENLVNNLADAIEMQGEASGGMITDERMKVNEDSRPFEEVREEALGLWNTLISANPENKDKILDIVENIFGQRIRLSEITPQQQDLFELVVSDMRDLVNK